MKKVEELAGLADCGAMRCDAIAKHAKLLDFYHQLAYKEKGICQVYDWQGIEWDVVCFEKIVKS